MQRFNSFNLIHKALRALMYDTALTLQQTYFADAREAESALEKLQVVIEQFEHHAHNEDTFVLPQIASFEPAVVDELEKEHVKDLELGNKLITLVNVFRSLELDEEKINCGSCINKSFRDFMVFNLDHMAKEESQINQALWRHYTDQELMDLNERIVANIPPAEKMFGARWMLRSINKVEAITWLKAVKKTAPTFVFQALLDVAETELPEDIRFEVLEAVLEIEMMN